MTIEKTIKSFLSILEKRLNDFYFDIAKDVVDGIPFDKDIAKITAKTLEAQIVILRKVLEESEGK